MESRKWQDKDGKNRVSWYVNCESANGVGSRQDGQADIQTAPAAESFGAPVPERQPEYSQSYWQQGMGYQMPPEDYAMLTDDDSQLPF
jgi:single-stranded DNA-binding protein